MKPRRSLLDEVRSGRCRVERATRGRAVLLGQRWAEHQGDLYSTAMLVPNRLIRMGIALLARVCTILQMNSRQYLSEPFLLQRGVVGAGSSQGQVLVLGHPVAQ
jgi:hypothetical protein